MANGRSGQRTKSPAQLAEPDRHDHEPTQDYGRQRRDLGLAVQLGEAPLESCLQVVGAAAGLLRVEPRAGPAGAGD